MLLYVSFLRRSIFLTTLPCLAQPTISAALSGITFTKNDNFLLPAKPGTPQLRRYHLEGKSRYVAFAVKFDVNESTTKTVSVTANVAPEYKRDMDVLLTEYGFLHFHLRVLLRISAHLEFRK